MEIPQALTLFERAFRYYEHSPRLFKLMNKSGGLPLLERLTRKQVLEMSPFPCATLKASVVFTDEKYQVELPNEFARVVCREWRSWEVEYGYDVRGKTVLDVGAEAGSTAWFYLRHGAAKVIAVERNLDSARYLRRNIDKNDWNVEIRPEAFKLAHLFIPHDFLKMDIEGGEILLLDYEESLGPCRMELHPSVIGRKTCDEIVEKFGLRKIEPRWEIWGSQ